MKSEPLISRLVNVEDHLDCTAGAYPYNMDGATMQQLGWVFDTYTNARMTGRISHVDEHEMRTTIEAVLGRITDHTLGKGGVR
jgi:hypothetical protein